MILYTYKKMSAYNKRKMIGFTLMSIIALIVGLVYEIFSHQVYSPYMYLMFLIPIIFGVLPILLTFRYNTNFLYKNNSYTYYKYGVITLTVGSFFKGVLEIYGTDSNLVIVYAVVGVILMSVGILVSKIGIKNK